MPLNETGICAYLGSLSMPSDMSQVQASFPEILFVVPWKLCRFLVTPIAATHQIRTWLSNGVAGYSDLATCGGQGGGWLRCFDVVTMFLIMFHHKPNKKYSSVTWGANQISQPKGFGWPLLSGETFLTFSITRFAALFGGIPCNNENSEGFTVTGV